MRKALYPGSFDPVTSGHRDIIRRTSALFDQLIVGVLHNPQKPSGAFAVNDRVAMLMEISHGLDNVRVCAFSGLLVDIARENGIQTVIRGLRSGQDFESEMQMARLNRQMTGLETMFLAASPEYVHISSNMVREIGRFGGDLHGLVPGRILSHVSEVLRAE